MIEDRVEPRSTGVPPSGRVSSDALKRVAYLLLIIIPACILSFHIVVGNIRFVFIATLFLVLGVFCLKIDRGVVALLVFLPFMGFLRRYIYVFNPWVEFDPILIVSDVLVLFMVSYLLIFKKEAIFASLRRDPLVRYVTFLLLVFFLQIFNPLQGGLLAGLAGAKFYAVPLLWFYLGLFLREETVKRTLRVWIVVGVIVAVYGLYQTFSGFAYFERYWIQWGGYASLRIGPYTRPFSTLVSAQEYAFFLMVAGTISFALFLRRKSILALSAFGLFVFALLMAAVRSALFGLGFSMFVLILLQFRGPKRFAFAGATLLVSVLAVHFIKTPTLPSSAYQNSGEIQVFLSRTYSGLADPFAAESTLWPRLGSWGHRLSDVFTRNPLGYGIGATTFGRKFGGVSMGTDSDLVSFFVSCGLVGGVLFLVILYQFFRRSVAVQVTRRDSFLVGTAIALVAGFVLVSSFSLYATGPFVWLLIGWSAKSASSDPRCASQ